MKPIIKIQTAIDFAEWFYDYKHTYEDQDAESLLEIYLDENKETDFLWYKPTIKDIGKLCWFTYEESESIDLVKLHSIKDDWYMNTELLDTRYCLLAINGRVAPKKENFF